MPKFSSEIFQKRLQQAIESIESVSCIADTILGFRNAKKGHDKGFEMLLERKKQGIKLFQDKIELCHESLACHGRHLTKEGVQANSEKFRVITAMLKPTDATVVQRLD